MADFNKSMELLPYKTINKNEYKGIHRKFFPKFAGFEMIDSGSIDTYILEDLAYQFYNSYFYIKLKCNYIASQYIADLLFLFSIANGKKKAVSKLQRVLKLPITGTMDFNTLSKLDSVEQNKLFLHLYAEIIEFYSNVGSINDIKLILPVYYKWEASLA